MNASVKFFNPNRYIENGPGKIIYHNNGNIKSKTFYKNNEVVEYIEYSSEGKVLIHKTYCH